MARRTVAPQPQDPPQMPAQTAERAPRTRRFTEPEPAYQPRTAEVVDPETGEVTYEGEAAEAETPAEYHEEETETPEPPPPRARAPAARAPAQPARAPAQPAAARAPAQPAARPAAPPPQRPTPPAQQLPATRPPLPVPRPAAQPPAELLARYRQDAGKGISTDPQDKLIPLIYLLQTNSPQVVEQSDRYVQGAVPGAFWLRNTPVDPIIYGDDGMEFMPCYAYKEWVEWGRPRGTGLVDRHKYRPRDAVKKVVPTDDGGTRNAWMLKNGNEVVETRYHIGYVLNHPSGRPLPYCIPLKGTGHTFSRMWTTVMDGIQEGDCILPSWACSYRLTTRYRRQGTYAWFQIELAEGEAPEYVPTELYELGSRMNTAFERNEKTVDASGLEDDAPDDTPDM